jgi:hypothetical protein
MTSLGWAFLGLSWGFIIALAVFCFIRVLVPPQK